jgi:transposase-like protein
MRNDRHLAIKLRRTGASYNKICKELGIPKSTMHYWFRDLRWSKIIKKELTKKAEIQATKRLRAVIRAQRKRWKVWRKQYREEAKKEFPLLKSNPLFLAGLMLYWGEGDGNLKNQTRLSNIDPKMIKLFSNFLQKACEVPKENICLSLTIYPDLSDNKCKRFWSNKTKISLKQFTKSSVIYGRHPTKRLENGICTLRANSSPGLKEKIIIWTNLIVKELNKLKIDNKYMRV